MESINYEAFAECPELRTIYAKNPVPASIDPSSFSNGTYMFATLYVPKGALSAYKNDNVWSKFDKIIETEYADEPNIPQPEKCSLPTISYNNGKLVFNCNTEGVKYVATINDEDIKTYNESVISLTATYVISVYATKTGFSNSDVVTATLCWLDAEPKTDGLTSNISEIGCPI